MTNATAPRMTEADRAAIVAHGINDHIDRAIARRDPAFGHGDWTTPKLQTLPMWHMFPGYVLEARFDNRIAALGGDVVVVGRTQWEATTGRYLALVEVIATGERHVLAGFKSSHYYGTVPSYACQADGFHAQYDGLVRLVG